MRKPKSSRDWNQRKNLLSVPLAPSEPPPVCRINRLLGAEIVDLSRVAREIRSHPDLESLVLQMAVSLALSPARSLGTLEETVFVLGTDRLRVLLYTWSLLQRKLPQVHPSASVGWTPEALYLASFLRYLGLDSPDAAILHNEMFAFALDPQRAEFADLRDTLMRDFLSLIPVLAPSILRFAPDPLNRRDSSSEGSS
ncbi:MAG TPA: HDOD domain-containing protein [Candidatus Acidoferrales bacterium]|nr:HDOD domain-containing protein [Candidatus Acidoferrales bacterium]